MAHNLESRKRAYDKIKARKKQWFNENGPCRICGSSFKLELDHIDPETKELHKSGISFRKLGKIYNMSHSRLLGLINDTGFILRN